MKKVTAILLILSFMSVQMFAQTPQTYVSGNVMDDKKKAVEVATLSLLKQQILRCIKYPLLIKPESFLFKIYLLEVII